MIPELKLIIGIAENHFGSVTYQYQLVRHLSPLVFLRQIPILIVTRAYFNQLYEGSYMKAI